MGICANGVAWDADGDRVFPLCQYRQDRDAPYRRRGIAAALTALFTRACVSANITTPFLTPAGEGEERIYRSVGYGPVTEMLHISNRTT